MNTLHRFLSYIAVFFIYTECSAQTITVSEMNEIPADGIVFVRDLNDEPAALVKIHFAAKGVKAEGNVLKMNSAGTDIYDLWLAPGTKMIRIKADDTYPLMIRFGEHGIKCAEGAHAYKLTLTVADKTKEFEEEQDEIDDVCARPGVSYAGDLSKIHQFSSTALKGLASQLRELSHKKMGDSERTAGYKAIADSGYWQAFPELIHRYKHGIGCKKSPEEARRYAEELVEVAPVSYEGVNMGEKLANAGYHDLAIKCYTKVAANSNLGWFQLAECYEHGIGTSVDREKAIEYYRYAANIGDFGNRSIAALIRLGGFLCSKKALDTQKFNIVGKTESDLKKELENAIGQGSNKSLIDFPKAFAIRKVLADYYDNLAAARELARDYTGKGAYPVKDQEEAEKYAMQVRRLTIEKQEAELKSKLEKISKTGYDNSFFTDYSKTQIGDYFYSDGFFSHNPNPAKTPVGMVFSLSTTPEESAAGFSHGYIIALTDAFDSFGQTVVDWAENDSVTNGLYAESHKAAISDISGWQRTNSTPEYKGFTAFDVARAYYAPLPQGKTSGWYLPSIGQLITLTENLGETKMDKEGHFKNNRLEKNCPFLSDKFSRIFFGSASEYDSVHPWILAQPYIFRHDPKFYDNYTPANFVRAKGIRIRPVASF